MNKLLTSTVLLSTLLSGCVVHSYDVDDDRDVVVVPANYAPQVIDADAGVFYDAYARDDVWYFDAAVDDPDNVYDVVSVWADVYDERSGALVESFELYPTDDPFIWYAEYLGRTTWLDPYYRNYSVDIVAYDTYDTYDVYTVWANTY